MSARQSTALTAPPDDLSGFPTATCAEDWHRAHHAGREPWWYSHDGNGRFDLAEPHGTCYLGSQIDVAVRERLGETLVQAGYISADEAGRMVVSQLVVRAEAVADTTDQSSTRYGITRELATTTPYALPQRWAAAFHAAGYEALRYWPRFSVGAELYAIGLFGAAGASTSQPTDPDPLGGRDACAKAGITVVGIPRTLPTINPD